MPKSGKIDIKSLDSLLGDRLSSEKSFSRLDSKTGRCDTGANVTTPHRESYRHADLYDALASRDTTRMRINRNTTFEETSQTSLLEMDTASALLQINEGNKELFAAQEEGNKAFFAALKERFLAVNNFGMSVGRQCLGGLNSQCTDRFDSRNAAALRDLDVVPSDILLMSMKSNLTMPSALGSPRMDETSRSKASSIAIDLTSENNNRGRSKKNKSGNGKVIVKQKSFGSEILGSLLGVDVAEIRGALNERLRRRKSLKSPESNESPQSFFDNLMCSKDSSVTRASSTFDSSCASYSSVDVSKNSLSFTSSIYDHAEVTGI